MGLDVGRVTAYFGGSGVSLISLSVKAEASAASIPLITGAIPSPKSLSLLQVPIPLPLVEVTLGDVTALGGFLVVVGRFAWDVYRDRREQRRLNKWSDK